MNVEYPESTQRVPREYREYRGYPWSRPPRRFALVIPLLLVATLLVLWLVKLSARTQKRVFFLAEVRRPLRGLICIYMYKSKCICMYNIYKCIIYYIYMHIHIYTYINICIGIYIHNHTHT